MSLLYKVVDLDVEAILSLWENEIVVVRHYVALWIRIEERRVQGMDRDGDREKLSKRARVP